MKRNVIILLTVAAVVLSFALAGAFAIAGGDSDPPEIVVLTAKPVRVVDGQTYIVDVPPLETGIVTTLVLSSESTEWDAPVDIAMRLVSVPPGVEYIFKYAGIPGQESGIVVERGAFPWSGGEEGYVWASVYYSSTKARVQFNVIGQPTERTIPR